MYYGVGNVYEIKEKANPLSSLFHVLV